MPVLLKHITSHRYITLPNRLSFGEKYRIIIFHKQHRMKTIDFRVIFFIFINKSHTILNRKIIFSKSSKIQ